MTLIVALGGEVGGDIGYEANDSGSIPQDADFCHSFSLRCFDTVFLGPYLTFKIGP